MSTEVSGRALQQIQQGTEGEFLGKDLYTDTEMLNFIAQNTTLHRQVELLYVVDGHEACVNHDDHPLSPVYKGATVRDALCAQMVGAETWDR